MASEGILLNAATTGLASLGFLVVGVAVARRRTRKGRALAAPLFFATVGLFLALAAARQVAAWRGDETLDLLLFKALLVPAALAIVPLVHLAAQVVWDRRIVADALALLFAGAALVGLAFAYAGGFTGPILSPWGTEWTMHSVVAKVLLIVILTLPGLGIGALLVHVGRRTEGEAGRRARLVGASCAVYYLVFTIDALGLDGLPLMLARLATAGTALVAYVAYFPGAFRRGGGKKAREPSPRTL